MSPLAASVSQRRFRARSERSYAVLDAAGEHPDLARVYPEDVFCRAGRCLSHDRISIYYRDDNHLSRAGADILAEHIMTTVANRWSVTPP